MQQPKRPHAEWEKSCAPVRSPSTVIVFGDSTYCDPATQFVTTVQADYRGQQGERRQRCGPVATPAGKPLGIDTADKKAVHIAFGDQGRPDEDRWNTVSEQSFVYRGDQLGEANNGRLEDHANLTPAQKYHFKPATAAMSAHIGLQTRNDFPIDDSRFKSYLTTHQDAYKIKPLPEVLSTAKGQAAGFGASNRTSNIPLGDPAKPREWGTMAKSSWVDHGIAAYKKLTVDPSVHRTSDLVVMDRGLRSKEDTFQSTTAQSFRGAQGAAETGPKQSVKAGKVRGYSSIAFGESCPQTSAASVSRQDYGHDPDACRESRQAVRSSVQDRLLSKPGIQAAICPTSGTHMESSMEAAYRPPRAPSTAAAAGICKSHPSSTASSFPQGDPTFFDMKSSVPTTLDSYQPYNSFRMEPHPVLGANITRSTFTFAQPDAPLTDYKSSSHSAFVPHDISAEHGHRHPPRKRPALPPIGDTTTTMSANKTTHQSHYSTPDISDNHDPHGRYAQPHPSAAIKPLLFPTRTAHITPAQTYSTTMGDFYGQRDAIWRTEDRKLAQGRLGSSVVFGDPRMRYYGDVVVKKNIQPVQAC
ncbi:hypothetical protein DFJ77DRAFT_441732 [Powellomyces hirtus]|nr:hypothetical protein DFJ77DRAFT_441732 [Powellomyces hirtus]